MAMNHPSETKKDAKHKLEVERSTVLKDKHVSSFTHLTASACTTLDFRNENQLNNQYCGVASQLQGKQIKKKRAQGRQKVGGVREQDRNVGDKQ